MVPRSRWLSRTAQRLSQIVAHRAADTAIAQQCGACIRFPHQVVVDPHLAELVDDDGDLSGARFASRLRTASFCRCRETRRRR